MDPHTTVIIKALDSLKEDLRFDIGEINKRLDVLNGRTRKVESAVSVHWTLWTIFGALILAVTPVIIVALF